MERGTHRFLFIALSFGLIDARLYGATVISNTASISFISGDRVMMRVMMRLGLQLGDGAG